MIFDEATQEVNFGGSPRIEDFALQKINITFSLVYFNDEQVSFT